MTVSRILTFAIAALLMVWTAVPAVAGSVFVTGHDPDFHAIQGANAAGAQNINQIAIGYVQDPGFNAFVGIAPKFLFVESKGSIPGGHVQGKGGIVASGYAEGVAFDHHDATTLAAALSQLGVAGGYSAIVVASDFGGILRQAELDILNAQSAAIIAFINAGGGLYAMAESNNGAGLTPNGGHYGFLPFLVSSVNLDQNETGYTVTPFGAGLGLTDSDVNGNFSHNVFTATGGMSIVDVDAAGRVLSLATRSRIDNTGVVPEPASLLLLGGGGGALLALAWRLRRR